MKSSDLRLSLLLMLSMPVMFAACSSSSTTRSSSSSGAVATGVTAATLPSASPTPVAAAPVVTTAAPVATGVSNSGGSQTGATPCYKGTATGCAAEYQIFLLTNQFRAQHSLAPFTFSPDVAFVARGWSTSQATSGILSHSGWPSARIQAYETEFHASDFDTNAENVAMMGGAGTDLAQQFVTMWINSPGHRANMLGQSSVLGVGVACTQDSTCYATQIFGFEGAGVQPGED